MVDLSTTYLGLPLRNPLVAAASPLSKDLDRVRRLEASGIAGIVMHSLFEEQIIHESLELDHYLSRSENFSAEATLPARYGRIQPAREIWWITFGKSSRQSEFRDRKLEWSLKGGWIRYAG
jgi:dihydroorotate dehydrogenase (fumarate)